MTNAFDQFDAAPSGGNPFDQFDAHQSSLGEKLMQTWPGRLAQSVYSAATAPGDVATGQANVAPTTPGQWSDEDEARLQLTNSGLLNRTQDLAAIATPASVAARAGEGIMGVPLGKGTPPPPVAPTIDELKSTAKAAYEAPEVKAVKISADAAPKLGQEIKSNLVNAGLQDLAPKTFAILDRLSTVPAVEEGETAPFLTVDGIRSLRRNLGNAAKSIDPTERLAARSSMQHVDEFLANLSGPDLLEGDPKAASEILKTANANYSAMKAASELDVRMVRAYLRSSAANSGMNLGNTIRQRMADILTNPKLTRAFTPDELGQMKGIVEGTHMGNATRFAGNVLGGGGGMLAALYGLSHAGVAPIAGYLLRRFGNAQTIGAANALNQSVRLRSPLGMERQAQALAQAPQKSIAGMTKALPLANPLGDSLPALQSPIPLSAQGNQNEIPGPENQKYRGGKVDNQQRSVHKADHSGKPIKAKAHAPS